MKIEMFLEQLTPTILIVMVISGLFLHIIVSTFTEILSQSKPIKKMNQQELDNKAQRLENSLKILREFLYKNYLSKGRKAPNKIKNRIGVLRTKIETLRQK